MKNKKDFEYMFDIDNESSEYEDIVSDSKNSHIIEEGKISLSAFSGKGSHQKSENNFFGKIIVWWKNRKTWQKACMISLVSLVLVVSLVIGIFAIVFDYNYNNIIDNPEELGFENVLDENIVNVALFGLDARKVNTFEGLSDSIMILSLNTETKKVKIISVMRDSFVPITYNGKKNYAKINSAYQKGGPELAIKTLNTIFGLDISEYATVNFYGMADIIDAVGGIDAELTKQEVAKPDGTPYHINGCLQEICANMNLDPEDYYIFEPGVQHLNGIQAVAYSRIRYVANIWGTNNDFGRTDRQRYVMEQLFNKAIALDKSQYIKLAKSLIPCCETSLSYTEIMGLAFNMLLDSPTFEQARVPQTEYQMTSPAYTGVGDVVYYDLNFAAKLIHSFIYDDITPQEYIEANGVEKNDWYGSKGGYKKPQTSTPSTPSSSSSQVTVSSEPQESSEPSESSEVSSSEDSSGDESETESVSSETEGTPSSEPTGAEDDEDSTETSEPEITD